jgi:hypothetical protein
MATQLAHSMNVLGDSARRIVGAGYGAGYGLVMDNLVTPEGGGEEAFPRRGCIE